MQLGLDRRSFLKALGATSLAGCSSAPESAAGERPNIVLIMADDMGFSDIGSYGGEISTPNLDALSANGLRFRQFYNAARCCPTRASLLTGLYAHQAGVGHMVGDYGHPSYQGRLNDRCVTIAEVLKDAGYTTLMSGKWHVGENRPHWPVDRGFDEYFGLISGGSNYFKLDGARQMATGNDPYTPPDDGSFYMTDAFSDNAVRFLEEHGAKPDPFFLYLPYTAPHWPLHAKPEDIERYVGKYGMGWEVLRQQRFARQQETGIRAETWTLSPRDPDVPAWDDAQDKALWERRMEVYAAMIDCMDQGIGRVVETIRNLGKLDNTLIMFLSDNGGCHEDADIEQGTPRNTWGDPNAMPGDAGSFDGYDRPWANASNTPFRMFKSWVHEGGISSPLVCHWPDGIKFFALLGGLPEPLRVADLSAYTRAAGLPEMGQPLGQVGSYLGAPIRHLGRHVGNFYLADKAGDREFSQADEDVVSYSLRNPGLDRALERCELRQRARALGTWAKRSVTTRRTQELISNSDYCPTQTSSRSAGQA